MFEVKTKMFAAKTVMLFGGIWLLLAFIILPAHASPGNVTLRSIDTFPLLDNPIPVQQAPIDYFPSLPAVLGSFHASAISGPLIIPDPVSRNQQSENLGS